MTALSLLGRRVLITRAADDAMRWAARLAGMGAHPMLLPCLSIVAIDDADTRAQLRDAIRDTDWLVVTSQRAVTSAAALLGAPLPTNVRVASVGPATARAARETWGRVDLVPTVATSDALGVELAAMTDAASSSPAPRVLIVGAREGRRDAEHRLSAHGWRVTTIAVYDTVPAPAAEPRRIFDADAPDDILLASPSAVTGLLNTAVPPGSARIFTIGPTTTAAARAAGLVVTAEARSPGLEGLLEAMQ